MESIRICSIQSFLPFSGRGLANKLPDNSSRFYEVFLVEIKGFSQRNNDSLLVIYLHPGLFTFLKKHEQKNRGRNAESECFVQSAIFVVVVIRARKLFILSKLHGFD